MFGRKKGKSWDSLSPAQQRGLGAAAVVQFALLGVALVDWFRRPAQEIRGPKLLWLPLLFVNFIGPLGYLKFGRQQVGAAPGEAERAYRSEAHTSELKSLMR